MSLAVTNEASSGGVQHNRTNGVDHDTSHVIVAGAGPAGLMLAYVFPE
jgi:hypothetical protein